MPVDRDTATFDLDDHLPPEIAIQKIDRVFLATQHKMLLLNSSAGALERLLAQRPYDLTGTRLSRASWNKSTPFMLEVDNLVIRPISDHEKSAFLVLLHETDIARMLVNLPHPINDVMAERWIDQRRFKGRAGFQLGVFHKEMLVGSIGISALSNALVYFIGREARGKGYAKKMVCPFVHHVTRRFALNRIFAGVFQDNPASRHILEAASFAVIGEGMAKSLARTTEAPFWEMEFVIPLLDISDSWANPTPETTGTRC